MKILLFPQVQRNLIILGENIKAARLRRHLSMSQVAERVGISLSTLSSVERGNPSVALGTYVQVLFILGLDSDISNVASDDILGRKMQDAELLTKRRAPRRKKDE